MKNLTLAAAFAAGLIAGCMAGAPSTTAQRPPASPAGSPLGSPFAERHGFVRTLETPLIIDRTDLRIGTTAQFDRVPTAAELHDLLGLAALAHVVLSLPEWPADFAPLQPLDQCPEDADLVVVLPGYPPSRAAAEAWNYVSARLRLVVVVSGPPPDPTVVADLNTLRHLERVIVQMDDPSRAGFERLQRPLSFRKLFE